MSMQLCFRIMIILAVTVDGKTKKYHRVYKRQAKCGELEFSCQVVGWCIQNNWRCDTERDCPNNFDEIGCPTNCSGDNHLKCDDGRCISRSYHCDGEDNCGDESDETDCAEMKCSPGEVQCDNSLCIEDSWLCDGDDDCQDGWDEKHCPIVL